MLPGWCCIAICRIGARERAQLIPHVRFQGSISGAGKSSEMTSEMRLRMCGPPLYFEQMTAGGKDASLQAKTYDLKSAYRQIPIRSDHLKYGYFCKINGEKGVVEIYRSRTLPFGAAHIVYNFLRLARMIYFIAA